jgi:hypothetical protein
MLIWEQIKSSGKLIATVVGALAIVTGAFTWDARYAKSAEQKQLSVAISETSDRVKAMDVKQNVMRLNSISEQMVKMRMLIKTYPKDKEIKDDYKTLQQEKSKVQEDLDKSLK